LLVKGFAKVCLLTLNNMPAYAVPVRQYRPKASRLFLASFTACLTANQLATYSQASPTCLQRTYTL
jgi:hypothetical protein